MVSEVEKILSMGIGEIISSPNSLLLLKLYSILYLNGGQSNYNGKLRKKYS